MRYIAAFLRISLVAIWIRILYLNDFAFWTTESCIWIAVIITAVYFAIIAQFWIEAVWCPMCKKWNCHIKK